MKRKSVDPNTVVTANDPDLLQKYADAINEVARLRVLLLVAGIDPDSLPGDVRESFKVDA